MNERAKVAESDVDVETRRFGRDGQCCCLEGPEDVMADASRIWYQSRSATALYALGGVPKSRRLTLSIDHGSLVMMSNAVVKKVTTMRWMMLLVSGFSSEMPQLRKLCTDVLEGHRLV